jgi:membrane protein
MKAMVFHKILRPLMILADKIKYPGEERISLLDIGTFFITGLQKGDIQARARSIAFDFFLAIFPAVIFFFTLIPYIPVEGFQERILILLRDVLPPYTFEAARTTIEDILNQPRGGLLSFGFLFALYVSTNGINSMIEGFNQSYHGIEVRSAFRQRMVSLFLTLMLAIIMITSITVIFFAEFASGYLVSIDVLQSGPRLWMMTIGTWIILIAMSLLMISCLYYFGPSKKNKRPFISVGSVTATLLLIVTTLLFNYFIGNFSTYNKIYGSIGTLIIILLWINFNSLQLIIGFELNASIENALRKAGKGKSKQYDEEKSIHKVL